MERMSDSEVAIGRGTQTRSRSGSVSGRQRRVAPPPKIEILDAPEVDVSGGRVALKALWGELFFVIAAVICVALFVFCSGQLPVDWWGKPVFLCICGFLSLVGFLFAFSVAATGRAVPAYN